MTVTANLSTETVEAVIISGPRKGEFVNIDPDKGEVLELTPAVEALLDEMVASTWRMAESAKAAVAEAEGMLEDMRQRREIRQ